MPTLLLKQGTRYQLCAQQSFFVHSSKNDPESERWLLTRKNWTMPTYKLSYFNFTGLGEPARFILSYAGIDFEDNRISVEDWPQYKPRKHNRNVSYAGI